MNRGLIEAVRQRAPERATGKLPRFMNRGLIEARTLRQAFTRSGKHFPDS